MLQDIFDEKFDKNNEVFGLKCRNKNTMGKLNYKN